jgi:hypothetical protein
MSRVLLATKDLLCHGIHAVERNTTEYTTKTTLFCSRRSRYLGGVPLISWIPWLLFRRNQQILRCAQDDKGWQDDRR